MTVCCAHPTSSDTNNEIHNYAHQVGGHIGLSSPDEFHVCKPCGDRELAFYRNMPEGLRPFVARFCGYAEGPVSWFHASSSPCHFCRAGTCQHRLVVHTLKMRASLDTSNMSSHQRERLEKARNYVVLSNLAQHFVRPCVLDLKLGTRQHGDDASEAKKKLHTEKCARSTSGSLGIRLCGMQYYDSEVDEYKSVNKYVGRELSPAGLEAHIALFLSDYQGNPRRRLCEKIMKKIEKIVFGLEGCDGVRLFGSSLLILYDGSVLDDNEENEKPSVEVRIVDFANTTFPGFMSDPSYKGPDEGCLKGLISLKEIIARVRDMPTM